MKIIHSPSEMADLRGGALVPTMGALHEGHAALIRAAAGSDHPAIVTIFVNPTQFGPSEDLAKYPRTLEADFALAEAAGAAAVYTPSVEKIYPRGIDAARADAAALSLPSLATMPGLEDAFRQTHFAGVCQVVAALFDATLPLLAFFGEKDYQQLRVIDAMVAAAKGRWPGLKIVPCPTVRDEDGLAMSSRNRYLSAQQRQSALAISRVLRDTRAQLSNAPWPTLDVLGALESRMRSTLEAQGCEVQYATVRSAIDLQPSQSPTPLRALVAVRLGGVRLIDNLQVWPSEQRG